MSWISGNRCTRILLILLAGAAVCGCGCAEEARKMLTRQPGYLEGNFIYPLDNAPTPECHASSIIETKQGLAAAWFGGTHEGNADVAIWFSRNGGTGWSKPVEIANGVQPDGKRYPCWNPVLFRPPKGPLMLFYKVGPDCANWWGMMITSRDDSGIWGKPERLPEGIYGPIKNKPVELPDGTLLCPSSTEHKGWRVHFETTRDLGKTWRKTGPLNDPRIFSAIQPTLLTYPGGKLQTLCRSREGRITQMWSHGPGSSWSEMTATDLPNPNSGIDAVTLRDGRQLLVYNHTPDGRSPLNVAVSEDGKKWKMVLVLEDQKGEFSYPAVIQTSDGKVHITYTYLRRSIKHAVLEPSLLGK